MTLCSVPAKTMKRAIVLNSFGRGGSNILMNMIGSSPGVLMAGKEFWQFYYDGPNLASKIYRRLGVRPGKMVSKSSFSARRFRDRIGKSIKESVSTDYQLWKDRGLGLHSVNYILFKVTDYDIFLNSEIESQFDETIFIGLVRNGYGLCDSWKRRGTPAKTSGKIYGHIAGQMVSERNSRQNFMLVRFEDLLSDPVAFLDRLYERLALPLPDEASYIHRPKGFGPGREDAASGSRIMQIVHKSYWESLLDRNINATAIQRLSRQDLRDFNEYGSAAMEQLYELRWK
jgi:hypothetical protein